jgi:hypothetical protein
MEEDVWVLRIEINLGVHELAKIRDVMNEVIRMHELNSDLLRTLVLMGYKIKDYANINGIPLLDDNFYSILRKADLLIKEISSTKTPIINYKTPIRQNFTEPETDDNFTESLISLQ